MGSEVVDASDPCLTSGTEIQQVDTFSQLEENYLATSLER